MKKFLGIFLALLMLFAMSVPVFAQEAAVEEPGKSVTEIKSEPKLDTSSITGLIISVFATIIGNLKTIPAEDFLKLPANSMADIVTAIFQVLRLFGSILG